MRTNNIQIYDLNQDINADNVKNQARAHLTNTPESCLFDPEKYNRQGYDYSLNKHRLTAEELMVYGQLATKIRTYFEVDTAFLEENKDGHNDALYKKELQRSLNLQR